MIRNVSLILLMLLTTFKIYAGTYYNDRYGFRIDYPSSFTPMGESENSDGQKFVKSNGEATITAWGAYNLDVGDNNYTCSFKNTLEHYKNLDITYKKKLKNGYVISGYSGDKIFYRKTIYREDKGHEPNSVCLSFEIQYPANQKTTYDKIIKEITNSFKQLETEAI